MKRKLHLLTAFCAAWCFLAPQAARADVPPVTVTTLDETTSRPVTGTTWYTMTIGSSNKQLLKQSVSATKMTLSTASTKSYGGEALWCFVQNDDNTYTLYNAAGGVLCSPTTINGNNDSGASDYCLVLDPTDTRLTNETPTYSSKWAFEESSDLTSTTTTPVYMREQSTTDKQYVNDFANNGYLSFWTGGHGAGSTLLIEEAEDYTVRYFEWSNNTSTGTTNGTWTGDNGAGTYFSGWVSTDADPKPKITTPTNDMYYVTSSDVDSLHLHTKTFTVATGTAGYMVTGYGFNFRGYSGTSSTRADATVTPATGGSATTCTAATQESTDLWVSGLSSASTTFTVASGAIAPKDFYFVLHPDYCKHPFIPTTITDGQFADDTHWYTLSVRGTKLATATAADEDIDLTTISSATSYATTFDASQQTDYMKWCFVGDTITGYQVYNKALGTSYALTALAAPTDGSAPTMMATADLADTYSNTWWFSESTQLTSTTTTPVFFAIGGYAVNDYGGNNVLKFWTGGMDAGSTFLIEPAWGQETSISVNSANGTFKRIDGSTTYTWNRYWYSNDGLVTLNTTVNNMAASDSTGVQISGNNSGTEYTITCNDGSYVITGYSMTVGGSDITVTDGTTGTSATSGNALTVTGLSSSTATFTTTASQTFTTTDFVITLGAADEAEAKATVATNVKHKTVVVYDNSSSSVPFRIPALGMTGDGNHTLYVACDYRRTFQDIGSGNGHNDVLIKKSTDNGLTWGWTDGTFSADGNGTYATPLASDQTLDTSSKEWKYSYGDPSIVVDRENPDNILIMAVAGHTGFFSSTYDEPQHVVRAKSTDGGANWTVDSLTYQIYNLTTGGAGGTTTGLFLTSGNIMQSRYIKTGEYYRLYIAYPTNGSTANADFVIYSDDFGDTWKLLGTKTDIPNTGADEAKTEELPDGSVLVSARVRGTQARRYSIFHYTDVEKAEGYWDFETNATAMTGNVNAVNGGILIVPATRVSDNAKVFVALQSITLSTSRVDVGCYFKELASYADYATASALAAGWTKGLQVSNNSSCYTTMLRLDNNLIGYCYEDIDYNSGYNIVFKQIPLEDLTNGLYTLNTDADADATTRTAFLADRLTELKNETPTYGKYVGMLKDVPEAITTATTAATTAVETASSSQSVANNYAAQTGLADLEEALQGSYTGDVVEAVSGAWYRIRNAYTPTHTLTVDPGTGYIVCTTDSTYDDPNQLCQLQLQTDGSYKLYFGNYQTYVGKTPAQSTAVPAEATGSYTYTLDSETDGRSRLACTDPTEANYSYLHSNSSTSVIAWAGAAEASYWYIEPYDGIHQTGMGAPSDVEIAYATGYYPFAYKVRNTAETGDAAGEIHQGAYQMTVSEDKRTVNLTYLEEVPANTPVVFMNDAADADSRTALTLEIVAGTGSSTLTQDLSGTLQALAISDLDTSGKNLYVLSTNTEGKNVGFYLLSDEVTTLKANRAYLLLDAEESADVRALLLDGTADGTTSITLPLTPGVAPRTYDLQGRRVTHPQKGGLYIQDGKKVIR